MEKNAFPIRTLVSLLLTPLVPTAVFMTVTRARASADLADVMPAFLMICYPWCVGFGGFAYLVLRWRKRDGYIACALGGAVIGVLYFVVPFALGPDRFQLSRETFLFPVVLAFTGAFSGLFFRSIRGSFARSP